jgi:cytochrome c-type biogenesis protein CcmH
VTVGRRGAGGACVERRRRPLVRALGGLCALYVLAAPWWVGSLEATSVLQDPAPAKIDSVALEERVEELSSSLRCPVCLNLSIEDSPDPLARAMKARVREMLAAGASPEEVRQHFVERYGDWILLTPEPQGLNLALWILPVLGLIGGVILIWMAVRRWVGSASPEAADSSGLEA